MISEPARESELVSVLVSETCSVIVVEEPSEPVKNSTRPLNTVVAIPSDPLRDLPMPLVGETVRERDPARDLAKLLVSEPVRDSEPMSVLNSPTCSVMLEDIVSVPVSAL